MESEWILGLKALPLSLFMTSTFELFICKPIERIIVDITNVAACQPASTFWQVEPMSGSGNPQNTRQWSTQTSREEDDYFTFFLSLCRAELFLECWGHRWRTLFTSERRKQPTVLATNKAVHLAMICPLSYDQLYEWTTEKLIMLHVSCIWAEFLWTWLWFLWKSYDSLLFNMNLGYQESIATVKN